MRIALASVVLLAGCAANGEPGGIGSSGECRADAGQGFIGRTANAEVGQELLAATGAARIRWVPPRTMVTADFQPDRLTVRYDDAMVIEQVSCT